MKKYILILLGITSFINIAYTQTSMIPKNDQLYHTIDRLEIKYGYSPRHHSALKYFSIDDIAIYAQKLLDSIPDISDRTKDDIDFIIKNNIDWTKYIYTQEQYDKTKSSLDSDEKGILKYFYKTPSSFLSGHHKDFFIKLNPVINFNIGKDIENQKYSFQNTRGFKISGLLNEKIYFYSSLFETQKSFLPHINRKIKRDLAIPGQGLFKTYRSSVLDGVEGYDFLNAQAYFGFKITKSLSAQVGHGKFFLGNGIRSLFLSDYSHNYYYLKFDTRVWKFHYQNIFAEMSAVSHKQIIGDKIITKKYMAAHYLSYRPFKKFEIGLFENVIFSRKNHFELQYLNPLIIYRTVEHFIGSPDNVLVGIDWKYNFLNRFSLYGQFLLDEFNFAKIKGDNTWWANKYGLQLGLKYIDVLGIDHLDMQVETNIVRPYTYSHRDSLTTYSHFNQALAHPLGANFKELIFKLRYTPIQKLQIEAKGLFALHGEDKDKYSYGGNILLSNRLRPIDKDGNLRNYGFTIGEGLKRTITQYSLNISYMIFHNYNIDFNAIYRNEISDNPDLNLKELYIGGGVRVNIGSNFLDY